MSTRKSRCVQSRAVGIVRVVSWLLMAAAPWFGNTAEAQLTEGYLPHFTRIVPPARAERVPLRLDFPQDQALREWPVTFGVPFPRGALASAENLRIVDGAGKTVPAQVLRTATWQRTDGDVKWVLIDISARQGTTYAVEYGTAISRTPVE